MPFLFISVQHNHWEVILVLKFAIYSVQVCFEVENPGSQLVEKVAKAFTEWVGSTHQVPYIHSAIYHTHNYLKII